MFYTIYKIINRFYFHLFSLQYLCLDNNELVTVPHLKLLGAGLLKGDQPLPPPGDAGAERTREAHSSASLAPFPQLQSISLRNNMVRTIVGHDNYH